MPVNRLINRLIYW